MAAPERHLAWQGCFNVRDLGGLPAAGGRVTRRGAVVRADRLDELTEAGWAALVELGVRTVVDLRNEEERGADAAQRPDCVTTVHVPLDGTEDREFWSVWQNGPQFGTPLYLGVRGTTAGELIAELLAGVDVEARLLAAGLTEDDVAALRRRMLDP